MFAPSHGSIVRSFALCVCVSANVTATETTTTVAQLTNTTAQFSGPWMLTSGPCSVSEDGCITSPNYPNPYGSSQLCSFQVLAPAVMSVHSFATESEHDWLKVDDAYFSGAEVHGSSPAGVQPNQTIEWESDPSVNKNGWKICPGAAAATTATTAVPVSVPPQQGNGTVRILLLTLAAFLIFLPVIPIAKRDARLGFVRGFESAFGGVRQRLDWNLLKFFHAWGFSVFIYAAMRLDGDRVSMFDAIFLAMLLPAFGLVASARQVIRLLCGRNVNRGRTPDPVSVYSDEHSDLFSVLVVLAIQMLLFLLLVIHTTAAERNMLRDPGTPFLVLSGFVSAGVHVLPAQSFWHHEAALFWRPYFANGHNSIKWAQFRFICSLVVNQFISESLLLLLPVLLMESPSNFDFVKDAVCVIFITEMDNFVYVNVSRSNSATSSSTLEWNDLRRGLREPTLPTPSTEPESYDLQQVVPQPASPTSGVEPEPESLQQTVERLSQELAHLHQELAKVNEKVDRVEAAGSPALSNEPPGESLAGEGAPRSAQGIE